MHVKQKFPVGQNILAGIAGVAYGQGRHCEYDRCLAAEAAKQEFQCTP
jgi:hypothetical protein